jgi:dihydropteroate synthase
MVWIASGGAECDWFWSVSSTESVQLPVWQSPHGRPLPAVGWRTLIMGVLNVTPDSFSDGGRLPSLQAVVDRAGAMLGAGADVLDVGGESTRPGAAAVSAPQECDRVLPALAALRTTFPDAPISIDTYKAEVAAAAVKSGADIVNDIWGALHGWTAGERRRCEVDLEAGEAGTDRPRSPMAEAVAALRCPVVLMHNRPDRDYADFWPDLLLDLRLSIAVTQAAGVPEHQIWLDPGFGFAKDPLQNLEVLKRLDRIVALGHPVLLGTSRKSTIGLVLDAPASDRLEGTGATVVWGIQQGCSMVRVHDVAAMLRFVRMTDAIRAGLDWKS